jgi:hypothetical protein
MIETFPQPLVKADIRPIARSTSKETPVSSSASVGTVESCRAQEEATLGLEAFRSIDRMREGP